MVVIKINAKRRPSCFKLKILLIATAAALLPVSFVKIAQPVSIFELESLSSFQQTTAEKSEPIEESASLSDELYPPRPSYHIIFSSGCSPQQNWQSYVYFYHALAVYQPGNVTRIASGCTAQQMVALMHFHERIFTVSPRTFYCILHLTTHESMRDGAAAAVTIRTSKLKRNEYIYRAYLSDINCW
jgi:hypothetical protein